MELRTNNYVSLVSTGNMIYKKKSKMEDNLSELGEPSSKAKYESLSDSE